MSEKQMRKMISYKIENLNPKERAIVDEWANGQFNIQQSLTNIIMHVVGFIGNVDVMDFDVQKKLHLTLGYSLKQNEPDQDIFKALSQIKTDDDKNPFELRKQNRKNNDDDFPDVDIFTDD